MIRDMQLSYNNNNNNNNNNLRLGSFHPKVAIMLPRQVKAERYAERCSALSGHVSHRRRAQQTGKERIEAGDYRSLPKAPLAGNRTRGLLRRSR